MYKKRKASRLQRERLFKPVYAGLLKRLFDIFCMVASAPLWIPLMAVIALLVGIPARYLLYVSHVGLEVNYAIR